MRDFFDDTWGLLTVPAEDTIGGWMALVLLWIASVAIVFMVGWLLLHLINISFRPLKTGLGEIVAMHFKAAHFSTTYHYNAVTKTNTPMTTWHPDAWKLVLQVEGESDDFYLSADKYVKYKLGEKVPVTYTTGRLWKSIKIKTATV